MAMGTAREAVFRRKNKPLKLQSIFLALTHNVFRRLSAEHKTFGAAPGSPSKSFAFNQLYGRPLGSR